MNVLITGSNGLIGANLCRSLLKRGYQVRALVRKSSDLSAIQNLPVDLAYGDVLQPETLSTAAAECELIFHAAAIFAYSGAADMELERTAVEGTSNMLAAASKAGARRFILTSSSVVFGSSDSTVVHSESDPPDHIYAPPYCLSKLHQEQAAMKLAAEMNIDIVVVNPCITVGPHDTKLSPSNAIIVAYLSDPFRATFPGGCNIVSVQDVADGHVLAAEKGRRNERYLLGSENMEWSLIHRTIAELCGVPGPQVYANHTASYLAATLHELWAQLTKTKPLTSREQAKMVGQFYWYSHAKAAAELGYAPRSARQALAEAIAGLVSGPHVSTELRRTLALGREVYDARIALSRESV